MGKRVRVVYEDCGVRHQDYRLSNDGFDELLSMKEKGAESVANGASSMGDASFGNGRVPDMIVDIRTGLITIRELPKLSEAKTIPGE